MAAIAASDVSYSIVKEKSISLERVSRTIAISFGDGALTYPSGGVPLTKGKMGCPVEVENFQFIDEASANGLVYKYDKVNNKIRIYQGDNDAVADGPLVELGTGATPALATIYAEVSGY